MIGVSHLRERHSTPSTADFQEVTTMSPIESHYGGKGAKVMEDMMEKYGAKKGKKVFYATENKRKKPKKVVDLAAQAMRKY